MVYVINSNIRMSHWKSPAILFMQELNKFNSLTSMTEVFQSESVQGIERNFFAWAIFNHFHLLRHPHFTGRRALAQKCRLTSDVPSPDADLTSDSTEVKVLHAKASELQAKGDLVEALEHYQRRDQDGTKGSEIVLIRLEDWLKILDASSSKYLNTSRKIHSWVFVRSLDIFDDQAITDYCIARILINLGRFQEWLPLWVSKKVLIVTSSILELLVILRYFLLLIPTVHGLQEAYQRFDKILNGHGIGLHDGNDFLWMTDLGRWVEHGRTGSLQRQGNHLVY